MNDSVKICAHILHDLREVENLIEYFENYTDEIPEIEIDLALDKLREIYAYLIRLKQSQPGAGKKISLPRFHSDSLTVPINQDIEVSVHDEPAKPVRKNPSAKAKTVADKFSGTTKNLNENLSRKKSINDLSSKFINKPIDDLGKALGVNDKYLLTKELFNGDREKFNQVINDLNALQSFEDAEAYIKQNFRWVMDNDVVVGFMAFLKRRYSN